MNRPRFHLGLAIGAVLSAATLLFLAACASSPNAVPQVKRPLWFGFHAMIESKADAEGLLAEVPVLAGKGVNLIIAEVDYNYEYVSHPELRTADPVSRETVQKLVSLCRNYRIRLIPEFQSLGHQSWEAKTFPLLVQYPQFDETPGKYAGNKDIYCRSWCPLHPELNPVVFALYDELIDAFESDALHVGMDEVFLIADPDCPRCKGHDPAELFARAVNDAYKHVVKDRGKELWMWGDRLIDAQAAGYGEWEASKNGTFPAIELIPRDIVICDWHYERKYEEMKQYGFPSVGMFLEKGFRVFPTSFRDPKAVRNLIDISLQFPSERMLGHLCTVWHGLKPGETSKNKALKAAAKKLGPVMVQPQ